MDNFIKDKINMDPIISSNENSLLSVEKEKDLVSHLDLIKCLMHPNTIEYIDFLGLIQLRLINKEINHMIDRNGDDIGYWRSICSSYCFFAGVFSPLATDFKYVNYKKHFFDELWISRLKWSNNSDSSDNNIPNQSYKIKVANRFRPGEIQSEKVCLPLHQFLKVKRHQQQLKQEEDKKKKDLLLVGEYDPEEYLDPFLGTLMKDPVLLTTSNKVLDRSVAVQCVLRGGRDPFNNKKLTMQMLIPQPELSQRIQEHRMKRQSSWDVSVDTKELKPLLDDDNVHAELLDALMEVEQINLAIQRAEKDAMKSQMNQTITEDQLLHHLVGDELLPETNTPNEMIGMMNHEHGGLPNDENIVNDNPFSSNYSFDPLNNSNSQSNNFVSRKIESAGIIEINDKTNCVAMHIPGTGVKPFHYSAVYKGDASQQKVYEKSAQDAITSVLNGYNASIMCYGQTGSGKTYTFFGPDDSMFVSCETTVTSGIVQRTFEELLIAKDFLNKNGINMSFTAQFIEIYEEQVTDLLTGQIVSIRRDTGEIHGAMEATNLIDMNHVLEILKIGHERKRFAATAMNDRSSRSHTAIVIHVLQKINKEKMLKIIENGGMSGLSPALIQSIQMLSHNNESTDITVNNFEDDKLIRSQLHLIDLAGSERIKKSKAAGVRLKEAVGINSSLLVLGKVISSLVKGQSHIPYFESKLTTMLKAAFGGNSKTTVIINCRSDCDSGDETLQSIRFGERCGMISNQMRQTATSYKSALATIEETLINVKSQLTSLEQRNKTHLVSYKTLLHSYQELERKRKELVLVNTTTNNEIEATTTNVDNTNNNITNAINVNE